MRRILGVLSLAKKYGTAAVDEACAAALDMGVQEYRFVRRYLERCPQAPLSLHRVRHLFRPQFDLPKMGRGVEREIRHPRRRKFGLR